MNKTLAIAIFCCVLPIVVIGFLLSRGDQKETSSNQQTEKTATETVNVSVGEAFPSFSVIDIDGASVSNESLKGKPTVLWFTTTWCTPCQIGAKKVAGLNKELGGTLNVLVFFVDPRESEDALRDWRNKYADADWKLVFNNGLAEKIGIQFLDSKYLLNKDGVIRDFNTQIVDDRYLALLNSIAKESR